MADKPISWYATIWYTGAHTPGRVEVHPMNGKGHVPEPFAEMAVFIPILAHHKLDEIPLGHEIVLTWVVGGHEQTCVGVLKYAGGEWWPMYVRRALRRILPELVTTIRASLQ
ncbi:MAG: hypothetical protein ABIG66_01020 [Candidatus Kerfeldbacteria bacterium]